MPTAPARLTPSAVQFLPTGFWLAFLSILLSSVELSCGDCAEHKKWIRFQTRLHGHNVSLGWHLGELLMTTQEGSATVAKSSFQLDSTYAPQPARNTRACLP